ncbi:hypothetical protein BDW59DRAFT_165364 [Aspergillus cavernicola]|uniref:Uncharacterized protein n=1 Tax=Aspergillus cavernicola TaxID=176166 RepID=A0ABR4HT89_9EURO
MPSFTNVLLTTMGFMASVMASRPIIPAQRIPENETLIVASIYQDVNYGGFTQELHLLDHCYGIQEGEQWYHIISSLQVHHGYTCDIFSGFKCDLGHALKLDLEGAYEDLVLLGLNDKIESIKCKKI